jgi:uncharacterized protein YprB with RNaseH-like and TPR domain
MNILLLDIETAPHSAYVWGLRKQNVAINQIINSGELLCYSSKWYGEEAITFDSVMKSQKRHMLQRLTRDLRKADVVVHYNGHKFDMPMINAEFIRNHVPPVLSYHNVDLLKVVRQHFRFPSYKLEYVAQVLGLGGKEKHKGFELWVECMQRDLSAWKTMEKYNIQDVILLEKLYTTLLPWIISTPSRGITKVLREQLAKNVE